MFVTVKEIDYKNFQKEIFRPRWLHWRILSKILIAISINLTQSFPENRRGENTSQFSYKASINFTPKPKTVLVIKTKDQYPS